MAGTRPATTLVDSQATTLVDSQATTLVASSAGMPTLLRGAYCNEWTSGLLSSGLLYTSSLLPSALLKKLAFSHFFLFCGNVCGNVAVILR